MQDGTDTHLKVRSGKHLGIPPLILKRQSLLIKILFGTFFWDETKTLVLTNLLTTWGKMYLIYNVYNSIFNLVYNELRENLLI